HPQPGGQVDLVHDVLVGSHLDPNAARPVGPRLDADLHIDPAPRDQDTEKAGEDEPDQVVWTMSSAQGEWWLTLFGTERRKKGVAPLRPLLPRTRGSNPLSASSTRPLAGSPPRTTASISTPEPA